MAKKRTALPKTLAECHALIVDLFERIEELEAELALLKRQLYGKKSERFLDDDATPDSLEESDVEETFCPGTNQESYPASNDHESENPPMVSPTNQDPSVTDPGSDTTQPATSLGSTNGAQNEEPEPKAKRTSRGRRRRVIPPDVERQKVYHQLNRDEVPPKMLHDPHARRFFRHVRNEIRFPRPKPILIEHYQEVIACDDPVTVQTEMIMAMVPKPFLNRSMAGTSLLAYIATSRFADHIPYYRLEDILRRVGLTFHRATLWRWTHGMAKSLTPLVERMRERLLRSHVLGIDETPIPILDPTSDRTRTAYIYAQYGDAAQPYVAYYFAPHKTRLQIEGMLRGYEGILQSDAYICYELITAASLKKITSAACWAHGRRKFEPLVGGQKTTKAKWILRQIRKLYDIEDRARTMSDGDRHALRQAESRTIVHEIETWLREVQHTERPRSQLRKGANYFLKRWPSFTRFLEDGTIPIDNNRTESVIRGPVMGKNAWLFLGNDSAGETAAILYSLVMSCKRHHIDPYTYLLDVMDRITHVSSEGLDELLPDRWIASHPEAIVEHRQAESHAVAERKRIRRHERRLLLKSA